MGVAVDLWGDFVDQDRLGLHDPVKTHKKDM